MDSSPTQLILALGEFNNAVNKLVQHMEKQEMRLEEKLDSTSLSSSVSESKAKMTRKVPVIVGVRASVVHSELYFPWA